MSLGISNFNLNSPTSGGNQLSKLEEASTLKIEIECVKETKKKGWQEEAIRQIRKSRMEDPEREIGRLKDKGIITEEIELKMDEAVGRFFWKKNELKAMLGRVLEIQNIYGATHHVLIHAQASHWLVYPDLVKELMRLNHPERDIHHYKFLRLPKQAGGYGIEHYTKTSSVNDEDMDVRTDLISADAYFFNNRYQESALDFLCENSNIMDSKGVIQKIAKSALGSFYPEMSAADLERYAAKISKAGRNGNLGNLFVFCIPKEKSAEVQYRAHAFGTPCTCHKSEEGQTILDQLQKGDLNEETECNWSIPPQFRIFTPALKKEENGVKIYLIPSDKKSRKDEKLEVRNLVQEIHQKFAKEAAPAASA